MITAKQNKALLAVAEAAAGNTEWSNYAKYCTFREKGLRKQAFQQLEHFLNSVQMWTFEQRIDFVSFLLSLCEKIPQADYGSFPQPLSEKLVKPTLIEWCDREQTDNRPFRWYGKYYSSEEHLFKALALNNNDDFARATLLSWWINNISYSVHHLPDYYIGDPNDDLQLAENIKNLIAGLADPKYRAYWTNELEEDLVIVRNYVEWQNSTHTDFAVWGKENHKVVGYNLTRVYYST